MTQRSSVTSSGTHEHAIHLTCLSKLNTVYQDHGIKIFIAVSKQWVFIAQTATTTRFHHWPATDHKS